MSRSKTKSQIDALIKSWERKSRNKKLYGEIYTQALKDCVLELRLTTLRADFTGASIAPHEPQPPTKTVRTP